MEQFRTNRKILLTTRFSEARELIGAVLLLASNAGNFVTDNEITVDADFTAMAI